MAEVQDYQQGLVSIITPVYNAEAFIGQTIQSVLAQTYADWELLLIDDCSKDNSSRIIRQYVQQDNRIKYHLLPIPSHFAPYSFNLSFTAKVSSVDNDGSIAAI